MMNWSEWENEQEPRRITMSPYWALAAIILGIVLALASIFYSTRVVAAPLFSATAENARIMLTDEPCALKGQISNLPMRAIWVEKDKTFEGCFGVRPDLGLVLAYFDDHTIALIPMQAFARVSGA